MVEIFTWLFNEKKNNVQKQLTMTQSAIVATTPGIQMSFSRYGGAMWTSAAYCNDIFTRQGRNKGWFFSGTEEETYILRIHCDTRFQSINPHFPRVHITWFSVIYIHGNSGKASPIFSRTMQMFLHSLKLLKLYISKEMNNDNYSKYGNCMTKSSWLLTK